MNEKQRRLTPASMRNSLQKIFLSVHAWPQVENRLWAFRIIYWLSLIKVERGARVSVSLGNTISRARRKYMAQIYNGVRPLMTSTIKLTFLPSYLPNM